MLKRVFNPFTGWYRKKVFSDLARYGLKYDDVIIADHPDVKMALKYLPEDQKEARDRRLRRAHDLVLKGEYLPEEIQKLQKPDDFYLRDLMEEFRAQREEREKYGRGKYLF